ncbi:hypothetical protein D3C76_737720 [compost metagenome]
MSFRRIQCTHEILDKAHLLRQTLDQQAVGVRIGHHANVSGGHLPGNDSRRSRVLIRGCGRQAFQGKRWHRPLHSLCRGLRHGRLDLALLPAQQILDHGCQPGDGHLVIAQLVFTVADKGVVHLDNANLLSAQQQLRALVIHQTGRLHHQIDIHRRPRHMERTQAVMAQRITAIEQPGPFEKRLKPGHGQGLQRHHRAFHFRGVIQVDRLAIAVPDQRHLCADPLEGPLR